MTDTRIFLAVPRPGGEDLRLGLSKYQGRPLANLRLWSNAGGGKRCPRRQGVTLPLSALPRIRGALDELEAHAKAEGLIEEPEAAKPRRVQ